MDTIEAIMTRKSVRLFTDREIGNEDIETILKAGMSGPTATNARDWSFIVVRNKEMLCRMAAVNGGPARPLRGANMGILICGDLERAFKAAPDYWIIDGAIAGQNMILAAHSLGIGSVWLGTYPQMERVNGQKECFGLPDTIVPHSIIAFGYPDADEPLRVPKPGTIVVPKDTVEENRVHYDKW